MLWKRPSRKRCRQTPPWHKASTSAWHARETRTSSEHILRAGGAGIAANAKTLFTSVQARALETLAAQNLPPHTLMQRAGLAVARLAVAIAPHAKHIWIPCGPGNNGGDGFEAAIHLKAWGKSPVVTCLGSEDRAPADAAIARRKAVEDGVVFSDSAPGQYDLCIDALFGIGRSRAWSDLCAAWIDQMNAGAAPVLAVDLPSGLDADTGTAPALHVKASHTLSLLTLKPGIFTADGREACGDIWFDDLGVGAPAQACAHLIRSLPTVTRAHNTHKGSYGDVCVVGGQAGMTGAALLAARAAIRGGAGRVYIHMLDVAAARLDGRQPELMFRDLAKISLKSMAVVAGCGGGDAIHALSDRLIAESGRLVLDADALNAIAKDSGLQTALRARAPNTTVITPHPLEAARLMQITTAEVQANRIQLAQAMANRFACTAVLKGSGTVIAAPHTIPCINSSGNARLATAGTGDVLAGLIGARLAASQDAFASACHGVFQHGHIADAWPPGRTLTAQDLAEAL